jgi:hypothetical protein
MKISAYIATLTGSGLTEDAARGIAKGQAVALNLVDDIGLTMPLASGLVKGLVANGLDEESATESARVAIAKGKAVDDLASKPVEPATAEDAMAQLEAASAELVKGKNAQIEMELDGDEDEDEDDDDDDDDGRPEGLDGDDRGKPETMPAKARKGGSYGAMKGEVFAQAMTDALAQVSAGLEAQFKQLNSRLDGIAKGVGAQGMAQVEVLRTFAKQTTAVAELAKGINAPRGPRSVQDIAPIPHPSEVEAAKSTINRASIATQALVKGAVSSDSKEREALANLTSLINSTASDADVLAAATSLGLA